MCAIAVIYRFIQRTFPQIDDIPARQLAIYIVYWGIRPEFSLAHTDTHISMGLRAYKLINKLSILTINHNDTVDVNFEQAISRERRDAIFECFIACERYYLKNISTSQTEINFGQIFARDVEGINSLNMQVVRRWDEIRATVAEISGTRA